MRAIRSCVAAATTILALAAGVTGAQARTLQSSGFWVTNVPCLFTDINPSTNEFACTGSNDWGGTLNGVTYFTGEGTYDPVTQAAQGTFDERFVGAAADGAHGTLHLQHSFTIGGVTDSNPLLLRSDAKVVGGTGGFKGATGRLKFVGLYSFLCCGGGTYDGSTTDVLASPMAALSGHRTGATRGRMTGRLVLRDSNGKRRLIGLR